MKLITAVVKPDMLDDVMHAVSTAGARGLTATEVRGFGQQYGHMGAAAPPEWRAAVLPKVRVDVVVDDASADSVTDAIAKAVNTGSIGDGKIWISPVTAALRVRTGERDESAV
jgi:nitrogen regulatory protein P-II 1